MGDANDVHEYLKNLIEKSSGPWSYGILWECSSQRRVLRFKDGYHRGSGKGNPKQVRIMGSCVSVAELATDNDNDAATQWFFKISMSQSFEINDDLPGHAFVVPTMVWVNAEDRDADPNYKWSMWERTKWAHQFGIRTFLCFPLKDKRVLELASTQIIPHYYSFEWIHNNTNSIHPIGTLTQQQQLKLQQVLFLTQQPRRRQQQLRQINILARVREDAVNEMKNRGKEKISDSKCSWTILTESSDRGTDGTFSCSHDYSGPS